MYNEQYNLTIFSVENKLLQITEKLKFKQNLLIEFTENDKVFKNKIFAELWMN